MDLFDFLFSGKTASVSRAIFDGHEIVSYRELFKEAHRIATWLKAAGVCQGELVVLLTTGGIDFIPFLLALTKLKVLCAPLVQTRAKDEMSESIERLKPTWILSPTSESDEPVNQISCFEKYSYGVVRYSYDQCNLGSELQDGGYVRYTSGTTGIKKGVCISHQSARARIEALCTTNLVHSGERVLCALQLPFHFIASLLYFIERGAEIITVKSSLPHDFVTLLKKSQAHIIYCSPYHVALIAESIEVPQSLRQIISTSQALPVELAQRVRDKHGVSVLQVLGNIEAGVPTINNEQMLRTGEFEPLGVPIQGYEVGLRTSDGKEFFHSRASEIPFTEGELLLRGPGLFYCYLEPYTSRAMVLENGWFATGDVVQWGNDGVIHYRGRAKSCINIGGMKVFPEEVEAVISRHPGVLEVKVFGINHQLYGERLVAEIRLVTGYSLNDRHMRSYLQTRLSPYKIPTTFSVNNSLAKTATGKISRFSMAGNE